MKLKTLVIGGSGLFLMVFSLLLFVAILFSDEQDSGISNIHYGGVNVSAEVLAHKPMVEKYAKDHHIAYTDRKDLLQKPEIIELFKMRIDTLQQEFAHYEQIKRFTLLPEPFSMEKGELTNTLKIKRSVLIKNYAAEIEKMYEE